MFKRNPLIQRPVKRLLLRLERLLNKILPLLQFREDIAHVGCQNVHEFVEERLGEAERAAVFHGAAEDAAEDVVAVAVAGLDAVGDGEAERADVVGDDAEGDVDFLLLGHGHHVALLIRFGQRAGVVFAAQFFDFIEDGLEDVGVVVGDFGVLEVGEILRAVDDGDDALEAHAGVHVLRGQRDERAVGVGVVLNEDVVPDFDDLIRATVHQLRPALVRRAIDVDFGAGAAGAGVAHHPEVVLLVAVHDVDVGVEADAAEFFRPEVPCLLVAVGGIAGAGLVDAGIDAFGGEFPDLDDQFPRPRDGFLLEIVAEGPVPEHLEERVVVGVEADVIEVVVLAAGADALLGIRRPGCRSLGTARRPTC